MNRDKVDQVDIVDKLDEYDKSWGKIEQFLGISRYHEQMREIPLMKLAYGIRAVQFLFLLTAGIFCAIGFGIRGNHTDEWRIAWVDVPRDSDIGFVCSKTNWDCPYEDRCMGVWWCGKTDRCFWARGGAKSWADAQAKCAQNRSTLASLRNFAEDMRAGELCSKTGEEYCYMGLHRVGGGEKFAWINGDASLYRNWFQHEPDDGSAKPIEENAVAWRTKKGYDTMRDNHLAILWLVFSATILILFLFVINSTCQYKGLWQRDASKLMFSASADFFLVVVFIIGVFGARFRGAMAELVLQAFYAAAFLVGSGVGYLQAFKVHQRKSLPVDYVLEPGSVVGQPIVISWNKYLANPSQS
jgi:hypothetical protein